MGLLAAGKLAEESCRLMVDVSKDFVLMSHCILAQTTRADGCAKAPAAIRVVINFLLEHEINMIQMPCPETLFPLGGLPRDPHGKKWYEQAGFRDFCKSLAPSQAEYAHKLIKAGNNLLGIIGVHFSPACSTIKDSGSVYMQYGIYMEELEIAFGRLGMEPPLTISVNPDWHNKLHQDLQSLLNKRKAAA